MDHYLGLDIGSISVNAVLINEKGEITDNRYAYCKGRPFHVLLDVIRDILGSLKETRTLRVATTGSGGSQAARLIGASFVNEIIAQSGAVARLYPQVRTVIEMGGEDSKLIFMEDGNVQGQSRLSDFSTNTLCAAGTGSFLDQQANRIGISIEEEFGALAMKSVNPPRIAGRCSVFAKSDMIHLQQIATPLHDIVAGLCFAVARNFKSTLGRGKKFRKPFIFQGGVAANAGMVRAFREIFELTEDELIIPEYYASMGAIGAAYHIMHHPEDVTGNYKGTGELENYLTAGKRDSDHLERLKPSAAEYHKEVYPLDQHKEVTDAALGIDVGSLSTNVVLIDRENRVLARRYLPTASKPLNAIQTGLSEIYEEVGDRVRVIAAGTTGSGPYLTGDFIGADAIRNEITAQATAAIAWDRQVDTIFEIGGQDSKYISIENGVVVDFEMNKVCAAGTGSFLEEQAEKLNINIVEEFGDLALKARHPVRMGDRCTVFMESDLNSHQQKGALQEDLVGGLAYSIVQNYIRKVVNGKRVGNKIFFQGGVTNNRSVVSAFEKVTGKPMTIPPHFDVTGAIGAAILARESMAPGTPSRFKGFDISKTPFTLDSFTCKECSNQCNIRRVRIEGYKKSLYYGGRCEKYEIDERKGKGKDIPNYFEERLGYLLGDYREEEPDGRISIGIPRALMVFYQLFPFWQTFFKELGFRVVLSDPPDQQLVRNSIDIMVSETCLPVELVHGHVQNLLDKGVDYLFLPFIVNSRGESDNPTNNCNCPWVQSYPFMVKSAYKDEAIRKKMLVPTLHFRFPERVAKGELSDYFKERFGTGSKSAEKAFDRALHCQQDFEKLVAKRGREVMASLPSDKQALVLLGRPYNTTDPYANLRLVEKLIAQDTIPIPVDYLPLEDEYIFDDYYMMYWPNGQKILKAARIVERTKNLFAVYLGNFRCGPDSFLTHYVREEMNGKPYLHLEVDEHSADAGMITRIEAFLDSLAGYKKVRGDSVTEKPKRKRAEDKLAGRVLYYPYARDTVHALAAASRYCGIDAEVLPLADKEDLELARKMTNGQECFPFVCTAGSFIKKLLQPGTDPAKTAFFMPDHNGPCRFGDYNKLQRIFFDRLGYYDVEIITPSNDNAYAEVAPGKAGKFRLNAWKGIVAMDILKKLLQERRPYELVKGETEQVYQYWLDVVIRSIEAGSSDLPFVLDKAAREFAAIPLSNGSRKPVIAILGETFMRDNPYCSGHLVEKLEALGAETIMAPFAEWLIYSSYRYRRDSVWKGDIKGLFKARFQEVAQHLTEQQLRRKVNRFVDTASDVYLSDILNLSAPYVHRDYDGDPIMALGSAARLAPELISGVVYLLPFTCMPGTLVASVSNDFRKDFGNIPWENIAYDGQEDTSIDIRLQAFMHQAREFRSISV
ncbi:MAG: acyl-CoA dehydratase activase [Bacteroidota bacterium]